MSSKVNEIAADWSSQQRKSNQHRYDNDGDVLGESEMTQPTTDGSFSEDDDVGWLGSIGADFRNLAACFKDSTLPVLGGMASLVHRTALTVAAEIAQLEREELTAGAWHCDNDADMESLFLPWEIEQENDISDSSVYVTDDELMDAILALSLKDATFSAPFATSGKPTPEKEHCCFLDEPRILLIRRLLDVDENLAAAHARLSGRGNIQELTFWRNYFHHCEETRNKHVKEKLSRKDQRQGVGFAKQISNMSSGILTPGTENDADFSDDASLVPVTETDDSSYVIYPAPSSATTFASTQSLEDMVLVGSAPEGELDDK